MLWRLSPLLLLIVLNAYFSFLFITENAQNWPFLFFALVALSFTLAAILVFVKSLGLRPISAKPPAQLPAVAIVKTSCNDAPDLVMGSLLSLGQMNYPKALLSFVLLDDSSKPEIKSHLENFCSKNEIQYINRGNRDSFKAGALNNYLKTAKSEYIVLLDSDEKLANPNFLMENIGFFSDEKVAVVQTNKSSAQASLLARSASAINEIFYNLVNPVSSEGGTGAFLGSSAILRTSAILKSGSFPPNLIEDVAFSLNLYLAGFKVIHNPKAYFSGQGAQSYSSFVRQHSRYIIGMTTLLPSYFASIPRIKLRHQSAFLFQYFGLYFASFFQLAYFAFLLYSFLSGTFSQSLLFASTLYLIQSILAVCIFSRQAYNSYPMGLCMYLMNFSISMNRLVALLLAPLHSEFTPTSSKSSANLSLLAPLIFAAPFLYFSIPVSLFSPIGIAVTLICLSQFIFLALWNQN